MAKKKFNVIREEMLQVATNVAQEKNIDQDAVFSAMEQALEKAARVKYGQEIDIRISIDRSTGDIKLNSYLEVVEKIDEEFQSRQILLEDAKAIAPPDPPSPIITEILGTLSDMQHSIECAIADACPLCSAPIPG